MPFFKEQGLKKEPTRNRTFQINRNNSEQAKKESVQRLLQLWSQLKNLEALCEQTNLNEVLKATY